MSLTALISYLVAVLFPLGAVYLVLVSDVFDTGKAPVAALFITWGLVGAFFLARVFNGFVIEREGYAFAVLYTAPVVEEIGKAALLLYFIRTPRFYYFIDGAVYGFATGIGFAISENVFYLSEGTVSLNLALARVLSATLMHATTTALFGMSLGLTRRISGWRQIAYPAAGLLLAILLHLVYNHVLYRTEGLLLLLLGVVIGFGGSLIMLILLDQAQVNEKQHLRQVLGAVEGQAVQQYGDEALHKVLAEANRYFGVEKAALIQRYLILHANIGILKSNLELPVNDRLKAAWQGEISTLEAEGTQIQTQLGVYVMNFFLRNMLPKDNPALEQVLIQRMMQHNPYRVHTFDQYILQIATTIPPAVLDARADLLGQVALFRQVSEVERLNLSRALVEKSYAPGEFLFEQGDIGDTLYIVEAGIVAVQLGAGTQLFGVGEVLGEMALLDRQPRSASAKALAPTQVLILRRDHFLMFIQSRPHVILAVLQLLASRVRQANHSLETSTQWANYLAEHDFTRAQATAHKGQQATLVQIALQLENRYRLNHGNSAASTPPSLS